jgi:hypothetical protein
MRTVRTILCLCLLCLTCLLGSSGCKKHARLEKTARFYSKNAFTVVSGRNPTIDPAVDIVDEIVVEYLNGRGMKFQRRRSRSGGYKGISNLANFEIQEEGQRLSISVFQRDEGGAVVVTADAKLLEDLYQLCLARREQFETRPYRNQADGITTSTGQPAPK